MLTRDKNWTVLNSTELDRSVQFSSVQFPAVHWTGDDLQRSATIRRRNWRTSQVLQNRGILLASQRNVCRCTKTGDELRRPATAGRSSQLVAGSIHSGKLNWTELNDPVQSSWVEFSFPLCIGFNEVDLCQLQTRYYYCLQYFHV